MKLIITLAICAGIAYHCTYNETAFGVKPEAKLNEIRQPATVSYNNVIDATLQKVQANKKDVNKDGKVNCIDYAVLFYQYYPYKDEVTISLNVNPKTGMNHLFNVILINGTWRAIEPQTEPGNIYFMRDVWGSKYDSTLNKVVTNDYLKYVK